MTISSEMPVAGNDAASDAKIGATVAGYGYSYAITSFLSALLVLLKETSQPVHDLLVMLTGHHWISHGVLDIALFIILGIVLSRSAFARNASAGSVILAVIGSTVVSGLIIAGFFII